VLTGTQPGGLLTTTTLVENYPGFPEGIGGCELMERMQKQAERFGARVKVRHPRGGGPVAAAISSDCGWRACRSGDAHHRQWRQSPHLGLESEHKLENKGVTFCATCDGALPIFRNQPAGRGRRRRFGLRRGSLPHALWLHRVPRAPPRRTARSKIMAERTLAHPRLSRSGFSRHRSSRREAG